jgi:REP-associated tyrosine transposase
MPRQARIHYPGGVFHIISRCLNHEFLLDGAAERRYYLGLLEQAQKRTDARVLAWCVMSNHVHLVVRAGEDPLARLMKSTHVGYANWKNRRERRIGPVFAERYKTVLVEEDAHLLELVRYVHLNPVRAGVTEHPDANDWSSHRFYAGLSAAPVWLRSGFVLSQFADDEEEARQRYRDFINDGLESERSMLLSGHETAPTVRGIARALGELHRATGPIIGSDDFIEEVLSKTGRRAGVVRAPQAGSSGRKRPPIDDLIDLVCAMLDLEREAFDESKGAHRVALAKRLVTRIWIREYGGRQVDIGRHLKTGAAIVSRWHSRAIDEARSHDVLYERIVASLPTIEGYVSATSGEEAYAERKERRTTVNVEIVREE